MKKQLLIGATMLMTLSETTMAQYSDWQHAGSFHILTTPEGANLPAAAVAGEFPLLVRLDKGTFDFSQARPNGEDIRFAAAGMPLAYQIDEWDATAGTASIWVRIPEIKGNARQEIKMYWGKPDAASESNGSAVFNESNGYVSVWHMSDPVRDDVGTVDSKDTGTMSAPGIVGKSRRFDRGKGINCGEKNTTYPSGSNPHSSEAWIRPQMPNATILGWGTEERQGKVTMQFDSPPHIKMDCYFSGGNVEGGSRLSVSEWIHVVHTYSNGEARIYVNGVLDGVNASAGAPLAVKSPARMYIGGWYDNYHYVGEIDEVRISKVVRSADWIKLQYENQKPQQTLVGSLVQPGTAFSVEPKNIEVAEGGTVTITAQAGGAQKVYWICSREGREDVVAVDQYSYTFDAGRVVAETAFVLQFKAVYANEVKTITIPVKIKEEIPEPIFTLRAPAAWNGRDVVEIVPEISNIEAMKAKGVGALRYAWAVAGGAVIKSIAPDRLVLLRSQYSGTITVTLTLNNGGADYAATAAIMVTEPTSDPWVQRIPDKDEKPENGQFYARDDKNEGTLYYNGTLSNKADTVFLKVYADDKVIATESRKPGADGSYAFAVKLKPGMIKYKVEFGTKTGGAETVIDTVTNLVCGDAYLIDGQSNALATDTGEKAPPDTSEWIRSYGRPEGGQNEPMQNLWCYPVWKAEKGEKAELGYWGMELAKRLVASQKIPIFIINGAVGGTRIDQHQRNEINHTDLATIYGRMLWRVQQAKLTHGIRGILWHQGENNQGSASPTGDYDWKSYQDYFVQMSAAWKQDFPNIQHYYIFQIWPNACSMGGGNGDMVREVQRTLPRLYSNMGIMSTLGIKPPGPCHYPLAGWAEFARMIQPLIERDMYGKEPNGSITPPDLKRAYYTSAAKDAIALEFDQQVIWSDALVTQFRLDGVKGKVASGSVDGHVVTLKLKEPGEARTITYLDEMTWSQDIIINGANGIAALTFCEVGIAASADAEPAKVHFDPTIESLKQYETPEWFADAKLGIYMHWGPQCVAGVEPTWYARWMYEQDHAAYKYHCATYGHPSKFGYKDICKLFKAEKFDQAQADRLTELYKRIGARYVVPVAVHHDNFDMWDSKYQPRWNSVATAGKDVVGMWKKSADKYGLHLGVASHVARAYRWLQSSHGADRSGPMAGVAYDGQDPAYADLYGVKWKDDNGFPDFWYEQMSDVGPPAFEKNFEDRMKDLIDKYHPDLYYTDGGIPFKHAGLNVLAHLYNDNQKWNKGTLQAVATIKLDWTPNIAVNNYEYGYPDIVQHYPWQSDKTMGADWYWVPNATDRYMTAQAAIHMLVDTVSKNGNLLLNVPLTPAGELEPETIAMLTAMGTCLDIIGEAIFSTRPWVVCGEGPHGINNTSSGTPREIRFTRNKANTILYVTTLGWPGDGPVVHIKTLAKSRVDLKSMNNVVLMGSAEKLAWAQDMDGLHITLPAKAPCACPAYALKLEFEGQIPVLRPVIRVPE